MMPVATVMPDDTPMFDPNILHELDWSFFKVLGQLTETGVASPEQFIKTFEHMKRSGDYYVTVVEDTNLGQIVATATLVIEHKFTHSCAKRGRIEDVVVSGECRGKQLGKLLTSTLTLLSKRLNCYKITLECLPKNVDFYKKFGYSVSEENYMFQRFFN
ncbi:glucosamine 6-phosphate N-acetyltransferase isoform X2 [Falco biarmicus]|uniref:glucosamine 6-phosphate N-acetyltransferase isoform X2 n=1 Tax=Falco peregrinus TaxID=8954 RepID=UPI000FFB4167|nr:glucosamine 6-phosphate N-acetyltransferase isoform X2 [Falco peregrinus]XP_027659259.1 glucosamine 6-phosphate N-acetyltransferase isoform X2 [Falco cherrug]XP_037249757.1 glucosamine 6-phosphate N-acetyltransferase isoform X2 [Falco rusticolus]XP_056201950.1 glucosamine 6-phosphate N-acetyltransferase isoform X2 [Falco biarmicus]